MVYFWATWLPLALRADPVVAPKVIEVPGWQTRGRGPELGFSFLPSGIVEHHTACMIKDGHDPQWCLNGILAGNASAPGPISQLLVTFTRPGVRWTGNNPDPHVLVIAAGRANHAGSGVYPWGAPAGNGSSIGIEACGPPANGWPSSVIELREHVTAAILRWNGWSTRQVTTHWEYVQPVRPWAKIDPSGRWYAEETLGQLDHWGPQEWRDMVNVTLAPTPPPEPPPSGPPIKEDIMIPAVAKAKGGGPHFACLGHRTGALRMGDTKDHDVTTAYVFGRGGGKAYDIGSRRVVSWSVDSPGSWDAVTGTLTEAEIIAVMGEV
jgi:hypothetical protein